MEMIGCWSIVLLLVQMQICTGYIIGYSAILAYHSPKFRTRTKNVESISMDNTENRSCNNFYNNSNANRSHWDKCHDIPSQRLSLLGWISRSKQKYDVKDNKLRVDDKKRNTGLFSDSSWHDIGINNSIILSNLHNLMKASIPTTAQASLLQLLAANENQLNNNLVFQAQTGSGKTIAYLLAILQFIQPKLRQVQAVVVAPTRELALQIHRVATHLYLDSNISSVAIIGGANINNQINKLKSVKPQIVVATPGRLLELVVTLKKLSLGMVKALIIDEVDSLISSEVNQQDLTLLVQTLPNLLKSTHQSDLKKRIPSNSSSMDLQRTSVPSRKLACFVSATADSTVVKEFVGRLILIDNKKNDINRDEAVTSNEGGLGYQLCVVDADIGRIPSTIQHYAVSTTAVKRLETLRKVLRSPNAVACKTVLIFVNDPYRVNIVCEKLNEMNIIAAPLSSQSCKDDRKEILRRINNNQLQYIVCTEIAARGLDIPSCAMVINFDLPTSAEHYLHRVGRCGRIGASGIVVNIVQSDTNFIVQKFVKQLMIKLSENYFGE